MRPNVLELHSILVGARLQVVRQQHRPVTAGDCFLLRGDSEASVAQIQSWRGVKEPRSGALMRILGMIEVSSSLHFEASHVYGVLNSLAGGISRWDSAHAYASALPPPKPRGRGFIWSRRGETCALPCAGLQLVRAVVAESSQRPCLGLFRSLGETSCGHRAVACAFFIADVSDSTCVAAHLLSCVAYGFSVLGPAALNCCGGHLCSVKYFHRLDF